MTPSHHSRDAELELLSPFNMIHVVQICNHFQLDSNESCKNSQTTWKWLQKVLTTESSYNSVMLKVITESSL